MERHDPFTLVTVTAEWWKPLFPWWATPVLMLGVAFLLAAVVVLVIEWRLLARRAPRDRGSTAKTTMLGLAAMGVVVIFVGATGTLWLALGPLSGATTVSDTDETQYVIASGTIDSAERNGDGAVDVRLAEDASVLLQFPIIDRFDPPELVGEEGRSITVTCTGTDQDGDTLQCDFTTPHQRDTALRSLYQNRKDTILDGRRPPADDVVITTQPYTGWGLRRTGLR